MKRIQIIGIDPKRKSLEYLCMESLTEMQKYVGGYIQGTGYLPNGDIVLSDEEGRLKLRAGDLGYQDWFMLFDWVGQTIPPLKLYGKSFICSINIQKMDFEDVKISLNHSRLFITFPILTEGGFVYGTQN